KAPVINSQGKVSLVFTCDAPEITINAPKVECRSGKEVKAQSSEQDATYLRLWNRGRGDISQDVTHTQSYGGLIRTNAETVLIEDVKGHAPIAVVNSNDKGLVTRLLLEDVHN